MSNVSKERTPMPKVYVINNSGHDFSAAKSYGDVIYMTSGLINKFNVTKMVRIFGEYFKGSHENDYILHSGPSVMNAIASSLFTSMHGKLNLLIWKGDQDGMSSYVCERINFKDLNLLEEREGGE